jgi:hypothetical protein
MYSHRAGERWYLVVWWYKSLCHAPQSVYCCYSRGSLCISGLKTHRTEQHAD